MQSRAVTLGIVPGVAPRVLDLPLVTVLALLESIVAESEEGARQIEEAYADARPKPPPPPVARGPERLAQIQAFAARR